VLTGGSAVPSVAFSAASSSRLAWAGVTGRNWPRTGWSAGVSAGPWQRSSTVATLELTQPSRRMPPAL